ncbi:NAD(P)/FAD-dependent oxidoreductase [Cohnella yongneupensis]|uniref:NAD(P)/FAD-dependent oxidoreductase n=1 Tax=Cohnella yongneupensis TaxID=425006 RepID=A0ABW0QYW4_9BACL
MEFDCAIIGGGPAGLNAALVLGRARRKTILFDNHKPRNAITRVSHGFLTRDGVSPSQFRELAAEELTQYPSIQKEEREIDSISQDGAGFRLVSLSGRALYARKIILATGLIESLPKIDGLANCYGTSIFNCPYCDGWELRDKPLVLLSETSQAYRMAMLLYNWSQDLIVCTNGQDVLTLKQQAALREKGLLVESQPVDFLLADKGRLAAVRFADGSMIRRNGGFVTPVLSQNRPFADILGCKRNENNDMITDAFGRTSVRGVYAAGDTATAAPSQLIIAAAAGSRAAIGVNEDLSEETFA